jgi:hypothetical protein
MKPPEIKNHIIESINPDALFADGFDEAIIGFVERKGQETVVLYDKTKVIEILMKQNGMDEEEAEDFYNFNIADSYVGVHTPAFATILKR